MKELKFRAWDKEQKCMVARCFGWLRNVLDIGTEKDRIILAQTEFELMQFTGLHDKNGKEIYESDILKDKDNIGIVFWNDLRAMFGIDPSITDKPSAKFIAPFDDWSDWEVIGNIYENKELLEAK